MTECAFRRPLKRGENAVLAEEEDVAGVAEGEGGVAGDEPSGESEERGHAAGEGKQSELAGQENSVVVDGRHHEGTKATLHAGREPDVYFWRDSAGHELDLLLDRGELLAPLEIKSGQIIASDFFKGLEYWRGLPGQEKAPLSLVYGGDSRYHRQEVAVYSWRDWL